MLGAIYMLWMYQRVFWGRLANEKNRGLPDLNLREIVVLLPLIVFMFWLGVRPGLILDRVGRSIEQVVAPVTGTLSASLAESGTDGAPTDDRDTEPPRFVFRDGEGQ